MPSPIVAITPVAWVKPVVKTLRPQSPASNHSIASAPVANVAGKSVFSPGLNDPLELICTVFDTVAGVATKILSKL